MKKAGEMDYGTLGWVLHLLKFNSILQKKQESVSFNLFQRVLQSKELRRKEGKIYTNFRFISIITETEMGLF